ncbi:hypothetical protein OJ998_25645 [Solirubrobacter taibaiensis]|nr:hypothetical protein [Solirubrobacter taibaiensis]
MSISVKRKLVAGAAGLAVLAGSGGAYAAGQSGPTTSKAPADRAAEQKAFLDDVAKRLNVTRDQLDAALKSAAEARIDAAVAAGKLTKEQGEAAKQRLAAGAPLLPGLGGGPGFGGGPRGGGAPGHGGPGFGGPGFGMGLSLESAEGAAKYLGITTAQLHEQLHAGKSLADVAKANNKSVDGLKAAIKDAATKRLDQAVKDGKLTQAQRDEMAAELDERIDDIVNLTPPDRPARPKHRWR